MTTTSLLLWGIVMMVCIIVTGLISEKQVVNLMKPKFARIIVEVVFYGGLATLFLWGLAFLLAGQTGVQQPQASIFVLLSITTVSIPMFRYRHYNRKQNRGAAVEDCTKVQDEGAV